MRPSWDDLTAEQRAEFGNGVGPVWFPDWLRIQITYTASWFFDEASWRHHDFGYVVGRTLADKFEYDYKFFRAMLRDAESQYNMQTAVLAIFLSWVFYAAVTVFGWFSFNFSTEYRSLEAAVLVSKNQRNIE